MFDMLTLATFNFKYFYDLKYSLRGLSFSSEGGGPQIYKKSASIELRPPYFGNKFFMTPHHRYTLPPKQAIKLY